MVRMTSYAAGGGCACKVPIGELESLLAGVDLPGHPDLLVGPIPATTRRWCGSTADRAVISTVDFFTPVVDDPYDWGRIVAANAMSDVWAMGGEPVLAVNLVGWPRDRARPSTCSPTCCAAGPTSPASAGCAVAGGHTIDAPEPLYGMAVTGLADPDRLLRKDAAVAGLPLSLTKPLGIGVLNSRHKATGEVFPQAVEAMTALNGPASRAALAAGAGRGHRRHRVRAARAPRDDAALVGGRARGSTSRRCRCSTGRGMPCATGSSAAGTRRNLEWVRPHLDVGAGVTEDDLLLLADAQTSGGLLVVGEVPGGVVIGETVTGQPHVAVR